MTKFTIFFRILWILLISSFVYFDRENILIVCIQLISLFLLTSITILRIIESRNEWREIIKDGDIEIKNHL